MSRYKLQISFTERLLASSPANKDVYKEFILGMKREEAAKAGKNPDEVGQDELETLTAAGREKIGWSVFHRDEKGIMLFDYVVRGFFKEAATAITGKKITAVKSKIDRWLFVFPRQIYLTNGDGKIIKQPESSQIEEVGQEGAQGAFERPIRVITMQGPRVSLKRSDYVDNAHLNCELKVLPLGETDLTEEVIRSWCDYGQYCGIGEWRTGSYGRFSFTLEKIEGPKIEAPKVG